MKKIKITNLLKFYILTLLYKGPKHGYELIKELEEHLERKVSASNVYPFLNKLEKNKFIAYKTKEGRDKKIFHLTLEGRNFAKKIFNRAGDIIQVALEPKLTICAHCGCKIFEGSYEEKIKNKKLKFCCVHCAASYKRCN